MTSPALIHLPDLPFGLAWCNQPAYEHFAGGTLTITAGTNTDWFVPPGGGDPKLNAPALIGSAVGDFILEACVEVEFANVFDAGCLVIWRDDLRWAKLCLEASVDLRPSIVSVVTQGQSDDCTSFDVDGTTTWLRISRIAGAVAFHASVDGSRWRFVRHFAFMDPGHSSVGFLAQSPLGQGCTSRFTHIRFAFVTLENLRSGD